ARFGCARGTFDRCRVVAGRRAQLRRWWAEQCHEARVQGDEAAADHDGDPISTRGRRPRLMVASTMHHETRIAAGELRGCQLDTADGSTIAFLGIPYAAPPIGARRFAQAEPAPQWTGVREATQWGASQLQPDDALSTLLGFAAPRLRDEDCLTINVWTPAIDDRRRPVLVWIHGGGFISGTSAAPVCDGARLSARGDIVVVSFNYRVGALGFLYLDDERSIFGLGDQIAALRWVRDNLAAFGGYPERV